MESVHEKCLLFAHFLESDSKLWIRFVPALPLQAAYYYDAHFAGGVLHRFLLHLTSSATTEQRSCRIALEVGSHSPSRVGLVFDVTSIRRDIALDSKGASFADANWPTLGDPLVRKSHEIVLRCRSRFGPAPTTAAILQLA